MKVTKIIQTIEIKKMMMFIKITKTTKIVQTIQIKKFIQYIRIMKIIETKKIFQLFIKL